MGENKASGVVSFRLAHEDIKALKRIAKDREMKVNAILNNMISKRIKEIRTKEGW